jgi:hypothetical protein
MEQLFKRKKRRKETLLLMDYECLTNEEVLETIHNIRKKLIRIFQNHIGEENSINPNTLFKYVYGFEPTTLDIYKRTYWWNVLKRCLSGLRKDNTLFVINNGFKLFVLKTQEESNKFKDRLDKDIKNLYNIKYKADDWVRKKKWKKI